MVDKNPDDFSFSAGPLGFDVNLKTCFQESGSPGILFFAEILNKMHAGNNHQGNEPHFVNPGTGDRLDHLLLGGISFHHSHINSPAVNLSQDIFQGQIR